MFVDGQRTYTRASSSRPHAVVATMTLSALVTLHMPKSVLWLAFEAF